MADDDSRAEMQRDAGELRTILRTCEKNGPTFSASQMAQALHSLRRSERELRNLIKQAGHVSRFLVVTAKRAARHALSEDEYHNRLIDCAAILDEALSYNGVRPIETVRDRSPLNPDGDADE